MSKTILQQDVSVLSGCKQGLVFLTANDWALIADKAKRLQFQPGDRIIRKGTRTNGVYLLLEGTAQVEISSQGTCPTIGPGAVCGEISFLDELPATAHVVAQAPAVAYYLERSVLMSMFELYPHLGSRFYRSLASSLSRRLRELIDPGSARI